MIDEVVKALRAYRLPPAIEAELHDAVRRALLEHGFAFRQEELLGQRGSRIDFLVVAGHGPDGVQHPIEPVGIECKVDGSPTAVADQLLRYAATEHVTGGLILLTSKASHVATLSGRTRIQGVPFRAVSLSAGAF